MLSLNKLTPALLWGLSLLIALVSWRFIFLGVELSMPAMIHHLDGANLAFYIHILFAPLALAILPFQFSSRLRARHLGRHRWLGRLYAASILLAGVAGLIIAPDAATGTVAATGFFLLSVVWLVTTGVAVWHARGKRITLHRAWMIRSAALTLAAVTLRLQLPIGAGIWGFETAYPVIGWACWVPNLIVAEWYLRRNPKPKAV